MWKFFVFIICFFPRAYGDVNLQNGGFSTHVIDIEPKNEIEIKRIYNSKTNFHGLFGFSFGTELDTFLTINPDGSIVVNEFGSGAENRFVSTSGTGQTYALEQMVEMILSIGGGKLAFGTNKQKEEYKKKLIGNAEFREREWRKLLRDKRVKEANSPQVGKQFISNRFSYQYITSVPDGFIRNLGFNNIQKFNLNGKLIELVDKNRKLNIYYGFGNKIESVKDQDGRLLFFEYFGDGTISTIKNSKNEMLVSYRYNDNGEMILSRTRNGIEIGYEWSDKRAARHLLQKIIYPDNTKQMITYYPKEQGENVKSVTDRIGHVTKYIYSGDPTNGFSRKVTVKIYLADNHNKVPIVENYELLFKLKKTGERWLYRELVTTDGSSKEVIYNECCAKPVFVRKDGEEGRYEYNLRGQLIKASEPGGSAFYEYEPSFGKISRFALIPINGERSDRYFEYDDIGRLILVKSSSKSYKLLWDKKNTLIAIHDNFKRQIKFHRDSHGAIQSYEDSKYGGLLRATASVVDSAHENKLDDLQSYLDKLSSVIEPTGFKLSAYLF